MKTSLNLIYLLYLANSQMFSFLHEFPSSESLKSFLFFNITEFKISSTSKSGLYNILFKHYSIS